MINWIVVLAQKLFTVVTIDEFFGVFLGVPFANVNPQAPGIAAGMPEGDPPVNQTVAIDIGLDGVTPNDPGDADVGQNGLQNFPVLTSAASQNGQTKVTGTLNSLANQAFLITLYSNSQRHPSGHGPGEHILGGINVTTDPQGNASFTFDSPGLVPAGKFITATATRLDAALDPIETSEFSQAIIVNPMRGDYNASGTVDAADFVMWRKAGGRRSRHSPAPTAAAMAWSIRPITMCGEPASVNPGLSRPRAPSKPSRALAPVAESRQPPPRSRLGPSGKIIRLVAHGLRQGCRHLPRADAATSHGRTARPQPCTPICHRVPRQATSHYLLGSQRSRRRAREKAAHQSAPMLTLDRR